MDDGQVVVSVDQEASCRLPATWIKKYLFHGPGSLYRETWRTLATCRPRYTTYHPKHDSPSFEAVYLDILLYSRLRLSTVICPRRARWQSSGFAYVAPICAAEL
jgi:hypothetical protein